MTKNVGLFLLHVQESRKNGLPIMYGDGSRPTVLQSSGISSPKAVMIMYTEKKRSVEAVQRLRLSFPAVGIPSHPLIMCT